ncbi:MAG TPA: cupredoxin family copper-binding protein [Gemmatimonadales bacterium]|nr:cupredoxin family copper-binding protein [Gemmatimonadales bacterium]
MSRRTLLIAGLCAFGAERSAHAQTVLDRTPNLPGAWVGTSGVLHFNFLHRFSISSAPERKVTATPTFLLAAGLPAHSLVGVHYATNSTLSPRYPNEWELFGRIAALDQERGAPLDAAAQLGYNLAAEGFDAEVSVARRQARFRILAALRVFAEPGEDGGADLALASGVLFRLTRHLALSADVASLVERTSGEKVAWGAGVNWAIPHTPHTLSLHATNTNNATLQSASRGTGETRYGFEFTIPITLSRYFGGGTRTPAPAAPTPRGARERDPEAPAGSDTVTAVVEDFRFSPARLEVAEGTTIIWMNRGQVLHTVTAQDQSFDSGPIKSGERRAITFSRAGTFPFRCTPHPFMNGTVVVR